jgi:alpha-L-arabinofuranosidase
MLEDNFIDEVVAIADAVAARRRSSRHIMLSFDEWNVWYRTRRIPAARVKPGWPVAPSILEEIYTVQDALVFGGMCISLLNHADRVKVGCLAQLVNAIAPIMTQTGRAAWRQTIFWPFAHFSNLGRGRVLRAQTESPAYAARYYDPRGPQDLFFQMPEVPILKLAAVRDKWAATLTLFALNRSLDEKMSLRVSAEGFAGLEIEQALQLHDADLEAVNTSAEPDRVKPSALPDVQADGSRVSATLLPASWNVIRLKETGRRRADP